MNDTKRTIRQILADLACDKQNLLEKLETQSTRYTSDDGNQMVVLPQSLYDKVKALLSKET
jgi:hypothetical protein